MPPTNTDFMSYCDVNWISDYTYKALATRLTAVNTIAGTLGGASVGNTSATPSATQTYQLVTVDADGALHPGLTVTLERPLHGNKKPVTLVDNNERTLSAEATLVRHGHGGSATLYIPVSDVTSVRSIEALGRRMTLR